LELIKKDAAFSQVYSNEPLPFEELPSKIADAQKYKKICLYDDDDLLLALEKIEVDSIYLTLDSRYCI
jgi:hypothetical protein